MGSINKELYSRTKTFTELDEAVAEAKDDNACSVIAVAIATNKDYQTAYNALKSEGREHGQPATVASIGSAIKELGYKLVAVEPEAYIKDYPGVHSGLRNVTTHHPDRFNNVWKDKQTYLFMTKNHVAAVIDGVMHDHSRGSSLKVQHIFAVVPKTAKTNKYLKERGAE